MTTNEERVEARRFMMGKEATAEPETKTEGGLAVTMQAPGYDTLARILGAAFVQSAFGKGKERHANDKAFDDQPINTIPDLLGPLGVGGPAYQVLKKTQEAIGMHQRGENRAAIAEMLGAIVYAAATINFFEKSMK